MRIAVTMALGWLLMIGGCSAGTSPADNRSGSAPTPAASPIADEPATAANAQAAKAIVARYFAAIARKDYRTAYALWGNGGADTRGSLKTFTDDIEAYSVYDAKVGEPTVIRTREGKQFILVDTSIDVKSRKTGRTAARTGTMMLSRSANPGETAPDKKEWRIWGMDVRVQH